MNAPSEFARLVHRRDGIDAFNEVSRIALADDRPARVRLVIEDGSDVVAVAFAVGDAPVELAVHPDHRRRGHGSALLDLLMSQGERYFWAHGDLPAARGWAALLGLKRERTLLRLARPSNTPVVRVDAPAGTTIRPFRDDDLSGLLAVNARAFAGHPEQRSMDRADFARRAASDWFNPADLWVAEQDGTVVGFHWTKVDGGRGEVYVLAVDPDHHGQRLGWALLSRGLEHLADSGVDGVELYVEEDNARALDLYTAAGFVKAGQDVLYVSTTPVATDPARS